MIFIQSVERATTGVTLLDDRQVSVSWNKNFPKNKFLILTVIQLKDEQINSIKG
jgi:hypothetical protein